MKLIDLFTEMTVRTSPQSDSQVKHYFDYLYQHGEHTGDQEGLKIVHAVYNHIILYGIMDKDTIVSICLLETTNDPTMLLLKVVHTLEKYRGKPFTFKLLWFIKNQEDKSIIDFGTQTADGQRLVKAVAKTGRFQMYWFNIKTQEKVPYDPGVDDHTSPFRHNIKPTDWRVLIERDFGPSFERYETSPFGCHYTLFE